MGQNKNNFTFVNTKVFLLMLVVYLQESPSHAADVHDVVGLTYGIAVVFHLFPVFQVHGPNMAVEQARGVGDCIGSCTVGKRKKQTKTLVVVVQDIRKRPF